MVWQEPFDAFERHLDAWKSAQVEDPEAALEVAREAVSLARELGKRVLAQAFCVEGSSFRALGRFAEADGAFDRAEELLQPIAERALPELADLYRRRAYLRSSQCSLEEAIRFADLAIAKYRQIDDRHLLGIGRLAKGSILGDHGRFSEAIPLLGKALHSIDPEQCEVSYFGALQNMYILLVQCDDLTALQGLRPELKAARRVWWRNPKNTVPLLRMRWFDALIAAKHGSLRSGVKILSRVRKKFVGLGMKFEIGLTALDLASFHCLDGHPEEARPLLAEAEERLEGRIEPNLPAGLEAITRARNQALGLPAPDPEPPISAAEALSRAPSRLTLRRSAEPREW